MPHVKTISFSFQATLKIAGGWFQCLLTELVLHNQSYLFCNPPDFSTLPVKQSIQEFEKRHYIQVVINKVKKEIKNISVFDYPVHSCNKRGSVVSNSCPSPDLNQGILCRTPGFRFEIQDVQSNLSFGYFYFG